MITPGKNIYTAIFETVNLQIQDEKKKYNKAIARNYDINFIETILSNIPEGILLINPELKINFINDKFKILFNLHDDYINKNLSEVSDKKLSDDIYKFIKNKTDELSFEYITGSAQSPVLIKILLKSLNKEYILMVASEIKDVLAEKELETCYYIIHGYSERETAKLLLKSRTTINSNKVRAKEKLKQHNLLSLLDKLR